MWKLFADKLPDENISIAIRDSRHKIYYFGAMENEIFKSYCNHYKYTKNELIDNLELAWMNRKEFVEFVTSLSNNGKII